ncbi:aldehyde dehydrogenase family protein [Neobacillus mesonae]|uniref:aldehyde dehydrogenase family protein n=1 Tax=Neobacillus mesonae TaxID=1193713 RepID=UPI00203E9CEF|nr:aldehyde dehydrogenase family protein [Neobacillus mesonae]MCM3567490.1 aldehyde dehydrogenase family protein [Neobacillus mesonae]
MSVETMIPLNSKAAKFVSTPKQLFINGKFVDAVSGKRFETLNPATGEVITTIAEGDKEDIDRAVAAARKAFEEGPWASMKPNERARLLLKFADLVEENIEELAHIDTLEFGQPLATTTAFASSVPELFRYYAGWATKVTGETIPVSTPGTIFNYTRREPLGVCAGISPWNAPVSVAAMKLAAPLSVGNTVVLKPAEQTPLSSLRLAELFVEAGFPDGVVNIVPGFGPTAGAALVNHPDVDKVAFTGSTVVGKEIMRSAAGNLKKVTLELGGKSPHIICADADYEKALANAAFGILFNSGQVCFAGTRLFVEKKIYDNFVSDLINYTKKYKLGSGFDATTTLGPLISEKQKNRVLNYLDIGQQEGAEMLVGGNAVSSDLANGYFVKPTVLANVQNTMTVAQEEIFGPVICAMPFDDLDEVVKTANETYYGLGAGICTTDLRKAHKLAHAIKSGNVWVNTYHLMDPASPMGGYKQSGIGRENGAASVLDTYTQIKSVWVDLD